MKKAVTAVTIVTAVLYGFILYYMLFRLVGRQMVITSEHMLENYNYWNSVAERWSTRQSNFTI